MQIQLNQNDIEQAIRSHVAALGITKEVESIEFSVSRKGGNRVDAEIELVEQTAPVTQKPAAQSVPDNSARLGESQQPEKFEADPETEHKASLTEGNTENTGMPETALNDSTEEEPTGESDSLFG